MSRLSFNWSRKGEHQSAVLPLLQIRALRIKVGIREVLADVNLDVYEGDVVHISGSNGSGKSTLLNAIAGLEPARIVDGTILFHNSDITAMPAHKRAELGLGYLRQRDNVFADLTVGENIRLALGNDGYKQFQNVYPAWVSTLPPEKRVSLLSGGQKQRLAWAMVTLRQCQLFLADEPEAGLSERIQIPDVGTYLVVSHSNLTNVRSQYET